MKKCLLFIICMSFSAISLGQINEIGFFIGGSNYIGDIGRTHYLYPNNLAGGLIYKWNWNPRIAIRGTLSNLPISGNDKDAETDYKKNRGYQFNNTINELALGLEYNFYDYDISSSEKSATPYILIEFAAFNYQSVQSVSSTNEIIFTNKTSFAIPFGVGYKAHLFGPFAYAIEAKVRYTFENDLDFSTSRYSLLNYGGKGNDWYAFTGISLFYTFGRPACYTQGL
ncbi:DUF6089 family protein [Polaribacter sp. HL-MS24]|uniref:type IX secretion system protein PorG n=1 Tax=Polaribacter sp. HL-MS24 TaxID=3077735 RepID=UPI002934BE83|nr:DUF6089 family protein [Polaribacter sp. HL-MS24]WOC39450.1 DUF6089 family protein [Polaribacter sp. HL-MS24]